MSQVAHEQWRSKEGGEGPGWHFDGGGILLIKN